MDITHPETEHKTTDEMENSSGSEQKDPWADGRLFRSALMGAHYMGDEPVTLSETKENMKKLWKLAKRPFSSPSP